MLKLDNDPDKFGFYEADNNIKTYSKLIAMQNKNPRWNFNDDVFSSIDWTINPPIDLWELYKFRAKQIREKYDYVVLWYSGGVDSHNILKAWIDADCKIDEIASFWDYDTTGNKNSFINAEIVKVVLPHINSLKSSGFDFKFRLVNNNDFNHLAFTNKKIDYEYFINFFFATNVLNRSFFREHIEDWKNIINSGKKLVFVWGKEKVHLTYENGKYFFSFFDMVDDCVNPYVQQNYKNGWYDEFFYWTPDCPLLVIKAAHTLKKFLETCNDIKYYTKNKNNFGYNPKIDMYLDFKIYKKLLYPKWDNRTFSNGKPRNFLKKPGEKDNILYPSLGIFSPRDEAFLLGNTEQKQKYLNVIQYYFNRLNIKNTDLLPLFHSKKYWLS